MKLFYSLFYLWFFTLGFYSQACMENYLPEKSDQRQWEKLLGDISKASHRKVEISKELPHVLMLNEKVLIPESYISQNKIAKAKEEVDFFIKEELFYLYREEKADDFIFYYEKYLKWQGVEYKKGKNKLLNGDYFVYEAIANGHPLNRRAYQAMRDYDASLIFAPVELIKSGDLAGFSPKNLIITPSFKEAIYFNFLETGDYFHEALHATMEYYLDFGVPSLFYGEVKRLKPAIKKNEAYAEGHDFDEVITWARDINRDTYLLKKAYQDQIKLKNGEKPYLQGHNYLSIQRALKEHIEVYKDILNETLHSAGLAMEALKTSKLSSFSYDFHLDEDKSGFALRLFSDNRIIDFTIFLEQNLDEDKVFRNLLQKIKHRKKGWRKEKKEMEIFIEKKTLAHVTALQEMITKLSKINHQMDLIINKQDIHKAWPSNIRKLLREKSLLLKKQAKIIL